MIHSKDAIEYIKNGLIKLIDSGQMNADYHQESDSISFYVYKAANEKEPLITLRTSDHRPNFQKSINPNHPIPSDVDNTNLSIEFYKPKYDEKGNVIRNRVRNGVSIPIGVEVPKPFTISSFSYLPNKLEQTDIHLIYQSILKWIYGNPRQSYIDPFLGTPKEAKEITKTSNIKIKDFQNISVDKNGNYRPANGRGADFIPENKEYKTINMNNTKKKNVVRLTESDLHRIIKESVNNILRETIWKSFGRSEDAQEYAIEQFADNIKDYLDCPSIGGYFELSKDIKMITSNYPQVDLLTIVTDIIKNYDEEEIEDYDYVINNLIQLVQSNGRTL